MLNRILVEASTDVAVLIKLFEVIAAGV